MADERDDQENRENQQGNAGQQTSAQQTTGQEGREQSDGTSGQPIGGNDSNTGSGTTLSQGADFGGNGSEPPRSMGTRGNEFGQFGDATAPTGQQGQAGTGQADLGSQADTTLAGRTDQQRLGIDQPGSVGGATGRQGEGFIGSQGSGSDDYLQDRAGETSASSSDATGGADFASQGRGALDEDANEDDSGSTGSGGSAS